MQFIPNVTLVVYFGTSRYNKVLAKKYDKDLKKYEDKPVKKPNGEYEQRVRDIEQAK